MALTHGTHWHRWPIVVWLGAAGISTLGDSAWSFSLNWASTGIGAEFAGLTNALYTGVLSCFLLFGGVAGDRLGQRQLMLRTLMCSVVGLVGFTVCAKVGISMVVLILAWDVISAMISGFRTPSQTVFVRQLVPPSEVPRWMSASSSVTLVMRLVGPALGGVLIMIGGISFSALINAITFVLVIGVLLRIRPLRSDVASPPQHSGFQDFTDGLRALKGHAAISHMLIGLCFVAGGFLPVTSLCLPLLAHAHSWSAALGSTLVMASTAGSLAVSTILTIIGPYRRPLIPMVSGIAISAAAVAVLSLNIGVTGAIVAAFLSGAGIVLFTLHLSPLYILLTPETMQSRFSSLLTLAQMLPTMVTSLAIGTLSQHFDIQAALIFCACVGALALVPLLGSQPLRQASFPGEK